jgi:hypothetical protein
MTNEVATLQPNAFESYANTMSTSRIVGELLKFAKGDYFAGQQEREIPLGTKLVAIMDQLMVGWVKWRDNTPVEPPIMGLLAQGYTPPRRSELDDNDKAQWEPDDEGKPRDPWQFTNYLILADPDTKELYTFTASSRGGLGAVGELCKRYGRHMREKPDEYPVIELGVGSYQHRNKAYGRIKFPVFKDAGWADKAPFVEALEGTDTAGTEPTESQTVQQQEREEMQAKARRRAGVKLEQTF